MNRRRGPLLLATAALAVVVFVPTGGAHAQAATNGRIAFQSARATSVQDIYTIDPDGSNTAGPLTAVQFSDSQPAFSPDGTKIAWSTFEFSGSPCCQSIAVMNADGSGRTKVINGDDTGSGINNSPTWSPDGQKLAFVSQFNGTSPEIGTVGADGTGLIQIGPTNSFNPAWSPDGTKIAFDTGHPGDIYTMSTDGTNVQQLTTASGDQIQPAWSPDGTKIAYVSTTGNGYEIFVMDANGSNPVQLTNNGDDDEQPAWSPDGTKIAFWSDRYVADFAQHDREIYTMDASDGSNQTRVTDSAQDDTHPSWQSLAAVDVVVTDCNDPALAQLTTIAGNLIVDNVAGCTALSLPNLTYVGGNVSITGDGALTNIGLGSVTSVGGNIDISDDLGATVINLGSLGSAGNVDITDDLAATVISLGSLVTSNGNVDISDDDAATVINLGSLVTSSGSVNISDDLAATVISLGSLVTSSGSVDISDDLAATVISLGSLVTSNGNVDISDNSGSAVVDAGALAQVDGDLTLESAGPTLDVSGASVSGDVTLTANGADSVSAQTGGGVTDVKVLGGTASMHVVLPAGSFDQPVQFTIDRQGNGAPETGTTAGGAPATIDPVAGYQFSFAVPTLNQQAQLGFTIDLAQLDAATRAALLAGVQDGSATIVVKGDAPGAGYQAIARCSPGQTPAFNGCVDVFLLDPDGHPAPTGTVPAFVRFDGVAGHFSSYAVALVTPATRDTTPPGVTITLSSPHAGTPDGHNGWFVSGPVTGSVSADDTSTGASNISSLACGSLTLTTSGLGTPSASGTFSIAADGITHISCTATDSSGNTSTPVTRDVKLDRGLPTVTYAGNTHSYGALDTVAITCTPADTVSGLASSTCFNLNAPGWTFGAGAHTIHATATDQAGNTGSGSTTFTINVTIGGLCQLTTKFEQSSAKYQGLSPGQKKVVDALAKALCNGLDQIAPKLSPAQKQVLIRAYKAGVQALVPPGWLTQTQATILGNLADAL